MTSGGKKDIPYVDDVFSTYVYEGTGATKTITNGIDLSGEGGMTWIKNRTLGDSYNFNLYDTERGATKFLVSNNTDNEDTSATRLNQFNNNGFRLGGNTVVNASGKQFLSWSFRKAPGFFDVVTFTSTGAANQRIPHGLECIPGMIICKSLTGTSFWVVYHKDIPNWDPSDPWSRSLLLQDNTGATVWASDTWGTGPTSTDFGFKAGGFASAGTEWVAYVFAGGASTAATAPSVDFDGSGDYLLTSSSSDFTFGTNDFTVEHWIKPDNITSVQQVIDGRMQGSSWQTNWCTYVSSDGTYRYFVNGDKIVSTKLVRSAWNHIAVVRSSAVTTLYLNGVKQGAWDDTTNYTNTQITLGIHGPDRSSYGLDGKLSNVRVFKGVAVYNNSFIPPTIPLTGNALTKLLCCNNASVTGSTYGTVTSGGNPTASTDSPFFDPAGYKFGADEDKTIIATGTFVGNGNNSGQAIEGPMVDIGWEPSWVLTKAISVGEKWNVFSSMTTNGGGFINFVCPNETDWEGAYPWFKFNSRGFQPKISHDQVNANGQTYVYVAIRRPDGAVGKPAQAGTDAFAMDYGGTASCPPGCLDSGFPVDFSLLKRPAATSNFLAQSRLSGDYYLFTNSPQARTSHPGFIHWDSNVGWAEGWDNLRFSWMFKRGAGLDVVFYDGDGVAGRSIPHNLGRAPEMIWTKASSANGWCVGHIGLNGGTNPWQYNLKLDEDIAEESYTNRWNDTAPISTVFTVGTSNRVNLGGDSYLAILFSSVDGISKCGYYDGSESEQTITTGFQPRFVIIKRVNNAQNWYVLDTTRGWSSGVDQFLQLNSNAAQDNSYDLGAPTSTGFTLTGNNLRTNNGGDKFIYYAHA